MSKIIRIEKCDESCPYYKETPVYDNSPDIRCMKVKEFPQGKEIPQFEEIEKEDGWKEIGEYIGGKIPEWCPLEEEKIMKMFEYSYYIMYGRGSGTVIAETKEKAIEMIKQNPYAPIEDLEVEEIDIGVSQIIDHSWVE